MTPIFKLTADVADITDKIADCLLRITTTGEAEFKSDTLTVK